MDWKTKVIIRFALFLSLGWQSVQAQTWEEWTQQRKLQTSYKTQHLLFMKNFERCLQEGYDIVSLGLSGIRAIQNEALREHGDYFQSLNVVSPELLGNSKVQTIREMGAQVQLVKGWVKRLVLESKSLNVDEMESALQSSAALANASQSVLKNLDRVLKTGGNQLFEIERLEVIDTGFLQMRSLASEIKSAFISLLVLEKGRSNTLKEQQLIRSLYE